MTGPDKDREDDDDGTSPFAYILIGLFFVLLLGALFTFVGWAILTSPRS